MTKSTVKKLPPGQWPADPADIPIVLDQFQLARLRGVCVRVLQKERSEGRGAPFRKEGSKVWYARDKVLAHYGVA